MRSSSKFVYRLCNNVGCRFRFPAVAGADQGVMCPICDTMTVVTNEVQSFSGTHSKIASPGPLEIEIFLDNIRSSYNVGSIFRTADGAGIKRLYLGGITPTPDHVKVAKTALGADTTITWTYYKNGLEAILGLKDRGWILWALESGAYHPSLFQTENVKATQPILLIVGNERAGIDPGILDVCDRILSLPMNGQKQSLNVSVAFGVAVYWLRYGHLIVD